ncbi:hypothetical protein L218DRAFT_1007761 [Marasmius fiardii PR-910]|nr:hypothetical protein L218DRAFT_1007761 [Marasmius fiardii PR-910]
MEPVDGILHIAATCYSSSEPIFVYFQDPNGAIRKFVRDKKGWSGGTTYSVQFQAKLDSTLGATQWTEYSKIHTRIYVLDNDWNIIERGDNEDGNWFTCPELNQSPCSKNPWDFKADSMSGIAATTMGDGIP